MTVEFRGPSQQELEDLAGEVFKQGRQVAGRSRVVLEAKETVRIEPTPMHPGIRQAVEVACQRTKIAYRRMNSGAGHDAIWMAKAWPTGMIFVPSLRGMSHASGEFTDEYHVGLGAQVLLETLLALDQNEGDSL
jgi:acetylornithine deacetylase/succinyl-diaminopimelate desuccinylase-like protein